VQVHIDAAVMTKEVFKQGAEARLYITDFLGKKCLIKERFKKLYRHPELERSLSSQRVKNEVRAIVKCRQCGIRAPNLFYVDQEKNAIYMEYLDDCITLKQYIDELLEMDDQQKIQVVAEEIGKTVAKLHENSIIHGDLTTSNFLVKKSQAGDLSYLILIDFGLTTVESAHSPEDKGVDLYVLERAFLSTHPNTEAVFETILKSYTDTYKSSKEVISKLDEVRLRGRKRTMVG